MPDFSPVVTVTDNITNVLLDIANEEGISADAFDFDLLSYETYYQGTVDEEWQRLGNNTLLEVTTEVEIRSSTFMLRQEYEIRIRPALPHPLLDLRFTIASDRYKSKLVAIIDPSSTIPLKKGIQEWIKEAIRNKQLRLGFMIGLFEPNLDREINRLLLKIQKEGPLKAPYRLPIGEFYPPILPIDDKVVLHYKHLKKENNFIDGVKPDDLLLEYIFPKNGRDGRGCDGGHIAVPDPQVRHAGLIVIDDETISSEQDEASIRFYARVSGYLQRKKGIFTISQELQIDSANMRKTGSIEAGSDKEISLKIKKKVASEDSVGTGVNIDVQKLDVSGTVGAHAKIQACELNIGAQTHKKSDIQVSEKAHIHLHRGNLRAKEATIKILEIGRVEADVVRVEKMVGGEIIARIVEVDTLYSNATITALESITVHRIAGNGNNLIIDPRAIESYEAQIEALELDIRTKTSRIQLQSKEFIARELAFKEQVSRVKQYQQRIMQARKNGIEPMKADVVRIQQFKTQAESLRNESEKLDRENDELQELRAQLEKLYEADLHAVVSHPGIYDGHTRIVFIDPKTSEEYAITPQYKAARIRLIREGDEKQIHVDP